MLFTTRVTAMMTMMKVVAMMATTMLMAMTRVVETSSEAMATITINYNFLKIIATSVTMMAICHHHRSIKGSGVIVELAIAIAILFLLALR